MKEILKIIIFYAKFIKLLNNFSNKTNNQIKILHDQK